MARMKIKRSHLWTIGCGLVFWSLIGMMFLTGCSGGSQAGAGSDARVPLTDADQRAVAMLGGFGGTWLKHTQYIIRLDQPPPKGANFARAWESKCREAFTIYNTTADKSADWLANLFVHEGQHHYDGCKVGQCWEDRAQDAVSCYTSGIPRDQCSIRQC